MISISFSLKFRNRKVIGSGYIWQYYNISKWWSEIFIILFVIPANRTSHHLLFTISVMISSHWTWSRTKALWQLIFSILTHIVSVALSLVAWLTEMRITPTKPLCYTAAELAFELYKVLAMLGAIFNWNLTTVWADQLFRFECTRTISLIHGSHTILPAAKIWIFALKALKIRINCHRILLGLVVIRRGFVL